MFLASAIACMGVSGESVRSGNPVALSGQPVRILTISRRIESGPNYVGVGQGPFYFVDCVSLQNISSREVSHVEIELADSDAAGNLKNRVPLDLKHGLAPQEVFPEKDLCVNAGPVDGRQSWRVGWIASVRFSDGEPWTAPLSELQAAVINALK
jgi:hypothetical protein